MNHNDRSLADTNCTETPEEVEVVRVFDAYLAEVQAGRPPDPERLLAEHPALADRLRAFLNVTDHVDQVAGDPVPAIEDYRIIDEIGRGGMGIVYEAEQVSRGRRVALKILPTAAALDPRQLKRFQVEIQAAQLLRHPHIVPIAAFGCERGAYYYAMQYIEGWNLAALIRDLRQLSGLESSAGEASTVGRSPVEDVGSGPFAPEPPQIPPGDGADRPLLPAGEKVPEGRMRGREPSIALNSPDTTRTRDHFREVARWGQQAAEALDHAHGQGVLHRDIKPSNLLIDVRGNLWVTDFGLAQVQGEDGGTLTGDLLGTLRYMSPEQALARRVVIDGRTDIYSLGATLYELLTLHPAFEGRDRQELLRRIAEEEPWPPRRFTRAIPRDLETIVLKAMAKEREDRYATSLELAEDLGRFLDHAPIRARRPNLMDRATKWAHRHRSAVAGGIIVGAIALVTIGVGGILIGRARAEAARHIAAKALAEAKLAEDRDLASRRELALQAIQRTWMAPHLTGWSEQVWTEVSRAAGLCEVPQLQPMAVTALVGLDAETRREFRDFGARSLAFDPDGRLLMGGVTDPHDSRKRLGTRLWDGNPTHVATDLGIVGDGPVGFRPDGTPIQLLIDGSQGTLTLVDLSRREPIRRYEIPGTLDLGNHDALPPVAMTPGGGLLASAVRPAVGPPVLIVWDGPSGQVRHRFETRASAVALAPDGSLVAGGDTTGTVTVWRLATGERVATLSADRNQINGLAFGRNPRLDHRATAPLPDRRRWQLAAGDSGAEARVWDLGPDPPRVRSLCRGSYHQVYTLAFSPDGALLASAGRSHAKLWDPTTGDRLLDIPAGSYQFGVGFAPDGQRLVIGSDSVFGYPGQVQVIELLNGRGIKTLRGLKGTIESVVFSPDDSLVAAWSHDWQIGVWERRSGRLVCVLDAPAGDYPDNASLTIDPANKRVAFASHRRARLWEIETGRELESWDLPIGLGDRLLFTGGGRLLLARVETADPTVPPYGSEPERYPRSCAVYDLLGREPMEPVRRIRELNRAIVFVALSPDGRTVVLDGYSGPKGTAVRIVNAFDLASGARLWSVPSDLTDPGTAEMHFDPTGKVLSMKLSPTDGPFRWLEMPSGLARGPSGSLAIPGPKGTLAIGAAPEDPSTPALYARGRSDPLLSIDRRSVARQVCSFSRDGHLLAALGPTPETILVFDLPAIQRRLTKIGLGW